jgi:pimeloyl-ACP methyl ester carboxylesterase
MGGYDQSIILAQTIGERKYRFIALSRPGYLGTPLSAGRSPEEQADLYAGVLDALQIPAAAIMAVSGGGPSAIHFGLRHPDRCWGVVLVSTCTTPVDTKVPMAFRIMLWMARWPWFMRLMEKKASQDPERAAQRSITDPVLRERTLNDPEVGPLFKALLKSTSRNMGLRFPGTKMDIAVSQSAEYPLEKMTVPVLAIHGTADRMVPFERHARPILSRIKGAELLAVQGGEHVAIFTHRDEVRPRVCEFLRRNADLVLSSDNPYLVG